MSKDVVRVAHVIGKWLGGGVEAVVMNYYRNIDHNKIQFDFICDDDSTNIPYEEIEKLGGKVMLVPPYQKPFKYHKTLKKILKEGNYKIVHSHINTLSVFSLFAAKCAGVPVRIAHNHSTTNKKEWKKNLLKQFLRPFVKVFATDYFACTEHAGRWAFGNKKFEKGKVFVLNNAIELGKFQYDVKLRREKRKEFKINDNTLVVGHAGRFVTQKNHNYIIDVFNEVHKKNSDSILMLVGQGPLMDEIKNKVKKLKLDDCVMFLGQRNDINELYQVFDIFLFPSLYEGLGMVLVEAQVSGLPCLASTEVPCIAKVTENLDFIDLDCAPEIWSTFILNYIGKFDRKSYIEEISDKGYNIKIENKKLENYYLCCYKKLEG